MPIVVGRVAHPSAALRGCHIGIRHEMGSICMRMVVVAVVVQESSGRKQCGRDLGMFADETRTQLRKRGE